MGDSFRTNIRTYRDSFQGIGCRAGCMLHLVFIGMIGVAALVWAIKNRAWELSVTVELPAEPTSEPEADEDEEP